MNDALTTDFPDLLKTIPEDEQILKPVLFRSIPGNEDFTELLPIIPISAPPAPEPARPSIEIVFETIEPEPITEKIEIPAEKTSIIEIEQAHAAPAITDEARRPRHYAGTRRHTKRNPHTMLYWITALGGLLLLMFGVVTQLYAEHLSPILTAASGPALLLAGAALTLAVMEKR